MTDTSVDNTKLFLNDPYLEWVERQNIPVTEGLGINILKMETAPWDRTGTPAGLAHLHGRGDFSTILAIDIPPGAATEPQQHLYEEIFHVLRGNGSTVIEMSDGSQQSFEWGPRSLFAIPLNARYRHYSGTGSETVRMASTNSLPIMIKLFRNEDYIFGGADIQFEDRFGDERYFSGDGDFIPIRPGRHMWETNFIPDLQRLAELREWDARGAGGLNIQFVMADSTMHSHISEMPVGTYKKAHRHHPDVYVWPLEDAGYTLLWYEGDDDFQRVDWEYGVTVGTPDMMFHQHFNTSPRPTRYMATGFGSLRYPFVEHNKKTFLGLDVSMKEGGRQLEYEDEDPRIRQTYREACELRGGKSKMDDLFPVGK